MHKQPGHAVVGLVLMAALTGGARAEWRQYRGPHHDGSADTNIRTNWNERPPAVLWKVPLGPGWSSPVVADGRVFTQVKRLVGANQREFTVALNADTGQTLWSTNLDRATYSDLSGYNNALDGPRTTPTVDGDRVYVLTSRLILACLRADTGAVEWQRNFVTEFNSGIISWQNAASPLVVGDLIFLNCNAATGGTLMAVRKSDGNTAWRSGTGVLTHATPVYTTILGVPQVVFLTLSGLLGVVPGTGDELWRFEFSPSTTSTAASPVVDGDFVYASAAYANGARVAQIASAGSGYTATQAWRQRGDPYQNHWATPVARDGFIYSVGGPGPGGIQLVCLETATGGIRWSQGTVGTRSLGFGSVQRIGDVLLVVNEGGELVLVKADPAAYTQLGVYKSGLNYCWNNAAVTDGRVYLRDPEYLLALDVAATPGPLPPLRLNATPGRSGGSLVLTVSAETGMLEASAAERIELRGTPDLDAPGETWTAAPAEFVLTPAGVLETTLTLDDERGFLRVVEKADGP